MTYEDALAYLYERLPMFQRVGAQAIKKDLTNTRALLSRCDNPHHTFPSVHIAGTNGKGSVTHMVAAIAMKAGYKVGYYTSPHLKDFRERIRINGEMIPAEEVADFVTNHQSGIEEVEPSFFEVTVTMAFDYFAKAGVDLAVVETGLGGRLDSTNVLTPEVAVITNVGMDHQAMLGDTLGAIASEKAGIIKAGIPVVIGEAQAETRQVFNEKALAAGAPLTYADHHWRYNLISTTPALKVTVTSAQRPFNETYTCDLPGYYQAANLLTTLETVYQLNHKTKEDETKWAMSDTAIAEGLAQVKALTGLRGRWEALRRSPLVICDIAHNPDAARWHRQQLDHYTFQHLHVVFGLTQEKVAAPILEAMPTQALYYFCQPDLPRAKPAENLQAEAGKKGLVGDTYPSVKAACEAALNNASPDHDMVLITGSAFVVSEALIHFDT